MKFNHLEATDVKDVAEKNDVAVIELNDLQLALVGGGGGEVVFH